MDNPAESARTSAMMDHFQTSHYAHKAMADSHEAMAKTHTEAAGYHTGRGNKEIAGHHKAMAAHHTALAGHHRMMNDSAGKLAAAMREVHTNTPSTVKRAKHFGPGGKEAMLRAIAYSKAGESKPKRKGPAPASGIGGMY